MSRRVYSEIFFHITWHTKNNLPLITKEVEAQLFDFLQNKILETPETFFYAIGGIENHLHIVVSVPPTIQPSEWIGRLKGASSYFINKEIAHQKALEWQNGFGIVSFGKKDLQWVVDYAKNQKERHKRNKISARLETIERED